MPGAGYERSRGMTCGLELKSEGNKLGRCSGVGGNSDWESAGEKLGETEFEEGRSGSSQSKGIIEFVSSSLTGTPIGESFSG
jgi:hypothetical protein